MADCSFLKEKKNTKLQGNVFLSSNSQGVFSPAKRGEIESQFPRFPFDESPARVTWQSPQSSEPSLIGKITGGHFILSPIISSSSIKCLVVFRD